MSSPSRLGANQLGRANPAAHHPARTKRRFRGPATALSPRHLFWAMPPRSLAPDDGGSPATKELLMTLAHPQAPTRHVNLSVPPIFELEIDGIPRHEMPVHSMPADVAYQIIHDELMLDGNARMNVATFVTTWM